MLFMGEKKEVRMYIKTDQNTDAYLYFSLSDLENGTIDGSIEEKLGR